MYNVLFTNELDKIKYDFDIRILISNIELIKLIPLLKWSIEEDEIYDIDYEKLPKSFFLKINKILNSNILTESSDYFLSSLYLNEAFSFDEYKRYITAPLNQKFASPIGDQIIPINNQPSFYHYKYYVWRDNMCVFQNLCSNKRKTLGFIHPTTKRVLFYKEKDYNNFKQDFKRMINNLGNKNNIDNKFIRTLCVYDKKTTLLKCRILNPQFDYDSIGFNFLTPLNGDEDLFFKSYELTEKIYKKIKDSYNFKFEFQKNRYFFETLNASDFTMSYQDLVSSIKTSL
jgi:cold shock CspA family protein